MTNKIGEILRSEFQISDDNIYEYIEGITAICIFFRKHYLTGTHCKGVLDGGDEFQNSNDVYEAIGEVLHDVAANKGEDEIR